MTDGLVQRESSDRELTVRSASTAGTKAYVPGELASPKQVLELAHQYRAAAHVLKAMGRRGRPLTWAPFRMAAIHAIELYLNALLLCSGLDAAKIRGLRHDLQSRKETAASLGLTLRRKTVAHIVALHQSREYLVTRYGPELASTMSQVDRLVATLDEVAEKVEQRFAALAGASISNVRHDT